MCDTSAAAAAVGRAKAELAASRHRLDQATEGLEQAREARRVADPHPPVDEQP
ncbi:hypothetical protein [Frankia sp. QA3]|uniref:hypothetical protein n=1 Tax=Frankia sp. QA3 TaxID=710111 RepID=UPI000269BFEE|nr:hypothetical protein [Frankia sp. QA3]EIV92470.1 hypothetical protein FraQA3DRAFT_2038 [Frankia sp. QA3]